MKGPVSKQLCLALVAWTVTLSPAANAFSLLGPFAPWMKPELGYHQKGDIGGPMNLGEEYRWTVPVVTYGFDQSFLDYFGQPGVDAVEQAIQILNDLPPASELSLTDYSFLTTGMNTYAATYGLSDLRSRTLAMLVEQMGLAESTRYVWTLAQFDPTITPPFYDEISLCGDDYRCTNLYRRSFDPQTLLPSPFVNNSSYLTFSIVPVHFTTNLSFDAAEFAVDPRLPAWTAVSDQNLYYGSFYTGLTWDDVGGMRYLISRTNVNVEPLDDSILPADGNASGLVRTAQRPGVEKITFVRHATNDTGGFVVMTNRFDDLYFTNGLLVTQQVCRAVGKPDIVFRAADLGFTLWTSDERGQFVWCPTDWQRSGTSRWVNNAELNGNPGGDGPGVIRPSVDITFHTPGRYLAATGGSTSGTNFTFWNWASLSGAWPTNITLLPGNQTNLTSLTLATRSFVTNSTSNFEWTLLGRPGGRYRIEAATNLSNWASLTTVTNLGGIFQFTHPLARPRQFFRAVLEQ